MARRSGAERATRPSPGTLPTLTGWSRAPADDPHPRVVGVLVYRGVSSSEVELVADALARPLRAAVRLVADEPGLIPAVEPARMIEAEPLDAVAAPFGLVVPGGLAWKREAERPAVTAWLRSAAAAARGVLAVSTGSLLLAAVGLLEGQEATGHWLAGDLLDDLGASPAVSRRIVRGRLLVTASGAHSGAEAATDLAREMLYAP